MPANNPDELDNILDEALAHYSIAEPRPGLEQRVLANVRAAGTRSTFVWWPWAAAVAACGLLLLIGISHRTAPPRASQPTLASNHEEAIPGAASVAPPRDVTVRQRPVVRRITARPAFSKPEVFPRQMPLSSEERALRNLATSFPAQALVTLGEKTPGIPLLQIEKLEIPPLPGGTGPE